MKKLWIVALVLLVEFSFAMAQEIHWGGEQVVIWALEKELSESSEKMK